MATKDLDSDFEKLKENFEKIKEIFTLWLMKANSYSIWWEQIFDFLSNWLSKVEESMDSNDSMSKGSKKSVWLSYRLIEEETKWLFMKNFLKQYFPP